MEVWAVLIASLVGFALLQLSLYIYLVTGRSGGGDSPTETVPGMGDGHGGATERVPGERPGEEDLVPCPECGTYNRNEQLMLFCKACGGRLD